MTVPLGKVKALCNESETRLVQASRRPALGKLTVAEAKRYRDRAKKLVDKWRDQSRKQSRTISQQKGFGDKAERSATKVTIFEDALKNFEEHLNKLEQADGGSSSPKKSRTKKASPEKSDSKSGKFSGSTRKSNQAKVKAAVKKQQPKKVEKKKTPTAKTKSDLNLDAADQREARRVATQTKIEESGLTSRTRGHVSAREKRHVAGGDS